MPKRKPSKPQVAESPVADVFENRHPSAAEKALGGEDARSDAREISRTADRRAHRRKSSTSTATPASPRFPAFRSTVSTPKPIFPKTGARKNILAIPGQAALHARHSRHRISRQAFHHAAVFRLRFARGDQPALQISARARRQRAFRGVRFAHADGLRLRPSSQRRRSWQVRRGHRFARRHGNSFQRNRSGENHGVDDHQFTGVGAVGDVSGGGGKTGRGLEEDFRHNSERHSQGIHRAEGIYLSAGAVDAAGDRYVRVRIEVYAALQYYFDQRISHPRGRIDRAAGTGLHFV